MNDTKEGGGGGGSYYTMKHPKNITEQLYFTQNVMSITVHITEHIYLVL